MSTADLRMDFYFATPVITGSLPNAGAMNEALRRLFMGMQQKGENANPIKFNTNVGPVFDSHFDLFDLEEAPIKELAAHVRQILTASIAKLNNYAQDQAARLDLKMDAWFHVTGSGGAKTLHNHPNASWSMVYYVDAGDPAPAEQRSGYLQIYDPRHTAGMYQDAGNMQWPRICTFNGVTIAPQSGHFIVFPSFLYHEALSYRGTRERVMVAVNAWVR